jgi:hypothetical protein
VDWTSRTVAQHERSFIPVYLVYKNIKQDPNKCSRIMSLIFLPMRAGCILKCPINSKGYETLVLKSITEDQLKMLFQEMTQSRLAVDKEEEQAPDTDGSEVASPKSKAKQRAMPTDKKQVQEYFLDEVDAFEQYLGKIAAKCADVTTHGTMVTLGQLQGGLVLLGADGGSRSYKGLSGFRKLEK